METALMSSEESASVSMAESILLSAEKGGSASTNSVALLANALERSMLAGRMDLQGTTHGGKRDLYGVFGYKPNLRPADFNFKYTRGDIAQRIVTAYPEATWSNPPEVTDDQDTDDETPFENAFKALAKKLKLWHYITRVDTLSQMGRYAVLMIGVTGGTKLNVPRPGSSKVAYLMPYGENSLRINKFVTDPTNERFGKPELYSVTITDFSAAKVTDLPVLSSTVSGTLEVHYTRTIHVAEGLLDNDVYGMSILSSIYNRLEDLEKVMGGGAEIYWLNGRGGLNLNVDKDAQILNPEQMSQDAEDFINQLSRLLKTKGMDVNPVVFPFSSPKEIAELLLQVISGATGIPKRILTGSEAGELASSQDESNWLSRVDERRKNHCETTILRPLIDLLIETGDLPEPKGGEYEIKWPELVSLSEEKKADIAAKKTAALAAYVNAMGADQLIPPQQFVEEILGMEYREDEIAEQAALAAAQEEADNAALEAQAETAHGRALELTKVSAQAKIDAQRKAAASGGGKPGKPGKSAKPPGPPGKK